MYKFAAAVLCIILLNTAYSAEGNNTVYKGGRCGCVSNTGSNSPDILDRMSTAAKDLKSYQADIVFLFEQPLFETATQRTGQLHFRNGNVGDLKIEFNSISQDGEPETAHREIYLFDGVWLTHLDYGLKQARKRQYAPKDQPANAFELARQNFPLVGFGGKDELLQHFKITKVHDPNQEISGTVKLNLEVKPDSSYADQYSEITLWLKDETALPAKITAVTTEEDIYTISFSSTKVNPQIDDSIFKLEIPRSFGETQVIPLENSLRKE